MKKLLSDQKPHKPLPLKRAMLYPKIAFSIGHRRSDVDDYMLSVEFDNNPQNI